MAYQLNDNPFLFAPKILDARYGPWLTTTEAKERIAKEFRQKGLTIGVIESLKVVEYWWEEGVEDEDLVLKAQEIPKHKVFEFNTDTDWSVTAGGYFIDFVHDFNSKVFVEVRDTQKKISVVVETVDINTERIYVPYDYRFAGYIIITKN